MARFTSKIALVTSCASGSGAAIVRRLVSEGATVIAADKSGHEALAAELGASVTPRHLDAASEDSIRDLETYIRTTHCRLDILVNNTGMGGPRCPILDVTAGDAEEVFRYNIHGAFLILQLALRFMTAQPTGGSIVLTASIAGLVGTPNSAPYAISKGAVIAMAKTAAVDPDYASDGEPEQHPVTPDGVQPPPSVRKRKNWYTCVVFAVLAQLVYTVVVLLAARELYYKTVCPSVAAPDRFHAWDVLEYEEVPADHKEPDEHHPYLGTPRPELDGNWNALLSSTTRLKPAWLRSR
ncbi:Short chain dehydrogenase [Colletotrichum sp. SAR 10_86]|nr:Short chain dehydrogenase [Colletotrichum sp. SAR 10_77]KAI8216152.1 Short chain dehydrogenase [Colletotrichum sp. SAR 10_86]